MTAITNFFSVATLLVALASCGGGGGTSSTENNPIVTGPAPNPVYFTEVKNAIPSLLTYYNALPCGKRAYVHFMPSIDMNADGKKDLLLMLWCGNSGSVNDDRPATNIVVSLIQNADGTFRFGNQELFGKDSVSLHGIAGTGSSAGLGDFNNDGRQDLALAPTLEDGRAFVRYDDGTMNWDSYPYVLLSQPDSTYKLERLPNKGTLNFVIIIKEGNIDKMITGGYVYHYENDKWTAVRYARPYAIDPSTVFFDNNIVTQVFDGQKMGIKVGAAASDSFTQNDYYHISDLQKVTVYDNATLGDYTFSLASIDGIDWVMPSLPFSCAIPAENGEIFYLVGFEGIKLTEKYTGQKLTWTTPEKNGNVTWDNYFTRVLSYRVSKTKITKLDLITTDSLYRKGFGLSCMDLNADNQKDIVLYRWEHERPVIWLNKNSSFSVVPENKIPNSNTNWKGHHNLITDLNGDNKSEFLYSPGLGYNDDYIGQYDDYQIFKAVDPL